MIVEERLERTKDVRPRRRAAEVAVDVRLEDRAKVEEASIGHDAEDGDHVGENGGGQLVGLVGGRGDDAEERIEDGPDVLGDLRLAAVLELRQRRL